MEHQSDREKAAKAKKSETRFQYRVKKPAKAYANEIERGQSAGAVALMLQSEKPELAQAVKDEARRIVDKRRAKAEDEKAKGAQVSLFDTEGGL